MKKTVDTLPPARQEAIRSENAAINKAIRFFLGCYIDKARQATCEGCQLSYPSQRDHHCMIEEPEYHVDRHFDNALRDIPANVVSALFAFNGRLLPTVDWNAYKETHANSLREDLELLLSPTEETREFNDFYECLKLFL